MAIRSREAEWQCVGTMDAAGLEEYDYYLRGHAIFHEFTPEAMLTAREIWREGLREFPESEFLSMKIGWTYEQFFENGWSQTPEEDLKKAYELAQEGLTDKNLSVTGQWVGHWLSVIVQLFDKRDYERAPEEAAAAGIVPSGTRTVRRSTKRNVEIAPRKFLFNRVDRSPALSLSKSSVFRSVPFRAERGWSAVHGKCASPISSGTPSTRCRNAA